MSSRSLNRASHQLTSVLCVLLVLNIHVWIGGCGSAPAPLSDLIRIDLDANHSFVAALEAAGMPGASAVDVDPITRSARVVFDDAAHVVEARFTPGGDTLQLHEFTFGKFGETITFSFDPDKRVRSIKTHTGQEWMRPVDWPLVTPTSTGVQAYIDANQELLAAAREVDQAQGVGNLGGQYTLPGGEVVDLGAPTTAGGKFDSALVDGGLLVILVLLGTTVGLVAGSLRALLDVFLIVFLLSLLLGTPGEPDPSPPADDCNTNGVEDATDLADGTSADCDDDDTPDECQPDGDGDGVIDACDNCPTVPNPDQTDSSGDGLGDACSGPMVILASSDRSWLYENVEGEGLNLCGASFTAEVAADLLGNSTYTYDWFITPPPDRPASAFDPDGTTVSDGPLQQSWFLAPLRPAYSTNNESYTVTVFVTGEQFGNVGTATFPIEVRILGDVNGDGCVDETDDLLIQADMSLIIVSGDDPGRASDVDCSGVVEPFDRQIAQAVADDFDANGFGDCD